MKKNLYSALLLIAISFNACINLDDSLDKQYFELSVGIEGVGFEQLKNNDWGDVPQCQELSLDYAIFEIEFLNNAYQVISSKQFHTEIYTPNNYIVTQPIKIEMDQQAMHYARLVSFLVYHDDGDEQVDDPIVRAAPAPGSKYANLVNNSLEKIFEVKKFTKEEVKLDVLCFDPLYIINFGFTWVNLDLVTIRNQCWFGNLCVDDISAYEGSIYANQTNGLKPDMPAIMKVDVLKYIGMADGDHEDDANWDLLITHSNEEYLGEEQCLEVFWPDNNEKEELFRFDLFVLLPDEQGVSYQYQQSYTFYDGNAPDAGDDDVFDFVIGDCSASDYPPEQNACTLTQGFWKTHTGTNKKTGLNYWGDETKPKPDDLFFNTGLTYSEIFNKKPSESKYYSLAHQYIAAQLNVEVGGVKLDQCSDVQVHYDAAIQLLTDYLPSDDLSSIRDDLILYAETLDLFNNGVLCTRHCD